MIIYNKGALESLDNNGLTTFCGIYLRVFNGSCYIQKFSENVSNNFIPDEKMLMLRKNTEVLSPEISDHHN